MHIRSAVILLLVGLVAALLAGCNAQRQVSFKLGAESELPQFVLDARPEAREAYRFAMANHEELEKYPCYCGCVYLGHLNNKDCYIQAIDAAGKIAFSDHAVNCGICVEITQDVMRLLREGKSSKAIRAYIDAQYSGRGPSTNTPPLS